LFNLGERNKLIFFNGTPEEGFENGAIISDEIIAKAKNTLSLEQLMATEETNKQVTTVNYYVNMGNEYVVVENNDLTVSKVKIDNRNEKQEVTDHLPELFKGVTRIYNKLNVTTDLSNEMNSGFIDETLYS
jgi:hypothetical protein